MRISIFSKREQKKKKGKLMKGVLLAAVGVIVANCCVMPVAAWDAGSSRGNTNGDHQRLVSNAGHQNGVEQKYIDLMRESCWLVDQAPYKECEYLHGRDNYLATLKTLWKYTKLFDKSDGVAQILNSMPNLTSEEKKGVREVCESVDLFLKNEGAGKTKTEKQYLIHGFTMHLLGDIYSHRTMIPQSYVYNNLNKEGGFTVAYFGDKWDRFQKRVSGQLGEDKKLYFSQIKHFWPAYLAVDDVKGKEAEAKAQLKLMNDKYIDNINFYPERYDGSRSSTKEYLKQFLISGNTFKPSYIKMPNGLKLSNFDDYKSRL